MSILVLSADDIRRSVSPRLAVATQRDAYLAVSEGTVVAGGGHAVEDPATDTLVFAGTGAIRGRTAIACKFGFQNPHNPPRGLPAVHAFVTLVDQDTGEPLACLNGTTVTTMRTAAGIAVAADALATPDSARLAVVGAGVQAGEAVLMIAAIRPIAEVLIVGRARERAAQLATALRHDLGIRVEAVDSVAAAADGADIVATCTTSRTPVVHATDLADGATVLTIGSYVPDRAETAADVADRAATIFVDDLAKASAQCGPVLEAARRRPARPEPTEIGRVLGGAVPGRVEANDVLVFHSVGLGVQDACLAWAAYGAARELDLGQDVNF